MHFGDNKQGYNFAWVEGSQIFKVGNVYYISVAAGGTETPATDTGLIKSRQGPALGLQYQDGNPIGHAIGGDYPSSCSPTRVTVASSRTTPAISSSSTPT